jgi:hypothetical protein
MDYTTYFITAIIVLIAMLYWARNEIKFQKSRVEQRDNSLKQIVQEKQNLTNQLKDFLSKNDKFNLLLDFLQDKQSIQVKKINKATNPDDTVFVTTSKPKDSNDVKIDVFSLNVGSTVAHCTVSYNGGMDIYSNGDEIIVNDKLLQRKTARFESMGFGNILIQRMIDYCQDNDIEELHGKVMETLDSEEFEKRKQFFISNRFTITGSGSGRASLKINSKKS